MKNIKQFFTYVVVGALIMALFISCKNDDKTGSGNGGNVEADTGGGTRTLSYYAGNWWGSFPAGSEESIIFTINLDGSVFLIVGGNSTISSTDITKNSDTSYTYHTVSDGISVSIYFDFSSDTEGTIRLEADSETQSVTVTKK